VRGKQLPRQSHAQVALTASTAVGGGASLAGSGRALCLMVACGSPGQEGKVFTTSPGPRSVHGGASRLTEPDWKRKPRRILDRTRHQRPALAPMKGAWSVCGIGLTGSYDRVQPASVYAACPGWLRYLRSVGLQPGGSMIQQTHSWRLSCAFVFCAGLVAGMGCSSTQAAYQGTGGSGFADETAEHGPALAQRGDAIAQAAQCCPTDSTVSCCLKQHPGDYERCGVLDPTKAPTRAPTQAPRADPPPPLPPPCNAEGHWPARVNDFECLGGN
jgi:hypothetical protein